MSNVLCMRPGTEGKPRIRVPYRKSADVEVLPMTTTLDIPVERVLNAAFQDGLSRVLVLGWGAEGEFVFRASFADGRDALWLIEMAKVELLRAAGV